MIGPTEVCEIDVTKCMTLICFLIIVALLSTALNVQIISSIDKITSVMKWKEGINSYFAGWLSIYNKIKCFEFSKITAYVSL